MDKRIFPIHKFYIEKKNKFISTHNCEMALKNHWFVAGFAGTRDYDTSPAVYGRFWASPPPQLRIGFSPITGGEVSNPSRPKRSRAGSSRPQICHTPKETREMVARIDSTKGTVHHPPDRHGPNVVKNPTLFTNHNHFISSSPHLLLANTCLRSYTSQNIWDHQFRWGFAYMPAPVPRWLYLLDRDGVLNEDVGARAPTKNIGLDKISLFMLDNN